MTAESATIHLLEIMTIASDSPPCPLCTWPNSRVFFKDTKRAYRQCHRCRLVFVPSLHWLSAAKEKAIYDLHENDSDDPGYRRFLSRLSVPLLQKLAVQPGQQGLDFGCGPGPTLSKLMAEHGHQVELYDPYYANDPSVFAKSYDFITATEVVEHLSEPARQWATLFSLLKQGGWLGIMTKLITDQRAFSGWHYIRDLSHICFYSRPTFRYLAERFDAQLFFVEDDVMLLRKR